MKMIETIFYKPAKYDYDKIVKCLNLLTNCTEDEDCFICSCGHNENEHSELLGEDKACVRCDCDFMEPRIR